MAPIIICGMHRSGTSLICRALESAGLFTGEVKEHNHEAVFFLALNQWMFEQTGATWDNTYNMQFINDDLAAYMRTVIGNTLNSPSATAYTGSSPHHQSLFATDNAIAWGWKDPRNTFTAPVWASIFPGAKLVHVCRNPLDVADSLRRRERDIQSRHEEQLAQIPREQLDGSMQFQQSPRLFHLAEGLSLWGDYTRRALELESRFGPNAIRVRYEDFLADPLAELSRLAAFSGLAPGDEQLQAAIAAVNPARRCAFMHSEELMSVYYAYRENDVVKTLGYDRLHAPGCDTAA